MELDGVQVTVASATQLLLSGPKPASERSTFVRARSLRTSPRRLASPWLVTAPALEDAWPDSPLTLPHPGAGGSVELELWVVGLGEGAEALDAKVGVVDAPMPEHLPDRPAQQILPIRSPDSEKTRGRLQVTIQRGSALDPSDLQYLEYPSAGSVHGEEPGTLDTNSIPPYEMPYSAETTSAGPSAPTLDRMLSAAPNSAVPPERYPTPPTSLPTP